MSPQNLIVFFYVFADLEITIQTDFDWLLIFVLICNDFMLYIEHFITCLFSINILFDNMYVQVLYLLFKQIFFLIWRAERRSDMYYVSWFIFQMLTTTMWEPGNINSVQVCPMIGAQELELTPTASHRTQ